jgi:O-acetyl-ADP-ribose deacetylase (regulator of RNase III)
MKVEGGHQVVVARSTVRIIYGRIQDASTSEASAAVVLPANEFFDDECIRDNRSALGAYMLTHFPGQIETIQHKVKTALQDRPCEKVEKEKGVVRESYGIGRCVYLNGSISSAHRMILVSVTQKRAGTGLRAEISFVFRAIGELLSVAVDNRLSDLYLPVIGSGHGGLRTEVALFSMVSALSEVLCKPLGPRINVNIVIFRKDENSKPEISSRAVRRVLRVAAGMFRLDPCS